MSVKRKEWPRKPQVLEEWDWGKAQKQIDEDLWLMLLYHIDDVTKLWGLSRKLYCGLFENTMKIIRIHTNSKGIFEADKIPINFDDIKPDILKHPEDDIWSNEWKNAKKQIDQKIWIDIIRYCDIIEASYNILNSQLAACMPETYNDI